MLAFGCQLQLALPGEETKQTKTKNVPTVRPQTRKQIPWSQPAARPAIIPETQKQNAHRKPQTLDPKPETLTLNSNCGACSSAPDMAGLLSRGRNERIRLFGVYGLGFKV